MKFLKFLISKTFLIQIGLALIVTIFLVFGLRWWLGYTTNHNQKIQVPNLEKLSLAEAKSELVKLDLDIVVDDNTNYNSKFPKNSVIKQNPVAGSFVKEKRKVYIKINASKFRKVALPDLNGKTRRQAETHLKSIGFKIGKKITWVPDIGKNVVRGLKYKGKQVSLGDEVPKNSEINLILGDGNR